MDQKFLFVATLAVVTWVVVYVGPLRGVMNFVDMIQRAQAGKNLTPAERAVLRFVKMLAIVFVLAAWPIVQNAVQNGTLNGQWGSVARNAAIAGASAVLAALWKYVSARSDLKKGISVGGVTIPTAVVAQEAEQVLGQLPVAIRRDADLLGITQDLQSVTQPTIPVGTVVANVRSIPEVIYAPPATTPTQIEAARQSFNEAMAGKMMVKTGASGLSLLSPAEQMRLAHQVAQAVTPNTIPNPADSVYFHPIPPLDNLPLGVHSTDGLDNGAESGIVAPVTNGQSVTSGDADVTPIVVPSPAQAESQSAVENGSTPATDSSTEGNL